MSLISVLICTRNRAAQLRETLAAMAALQVPAGFRAELLIVDNGSTDDTAQVVRNATPAHLMVRYLHEPRVGVCHARNAALVAAAGDFILFTDDDVRPPTDWLERMLAPILTGEADAVAGGVVLAPHLQRPWMTPCHRSWLAGTEDLDSADPGRMVGANMAMSRRVLEKVPRFDPELGPGALGFYDETLFSRQLVFAGYRIAARLGVAVEHHPDESRITRRSFLATAKGLGRSLGYVHYHWDWPAMPPTWGTWLNALLRVIFWRLCCLPARLTGRVVHEREMQSLMRLHTVRQYLIEQGRPRHYTQNGLVKLSAPTA